MKPQRKMKRAVDSTRSGYGTQHSLGAVIKAVREESAGGKKTLTRPENFDRQIRKWAAFYRCHPEIYARDLGLHLYPYQEYILYEMFHNNYYAWYAARGLAKTFIAAVFCLLKMSLYPGVKIVVAAGVKAQAMKIITEKMPLILEQAPILKREISAVSSSSQSDTPQLSYKNGSTLLIVASNDNARSNRANVLILDEFRLIDPKIYTTVLRRFLANARHPGFLDKPEYKDYPMERNQEIFLTSAYFKSNWSYEKYRMFLKKMSEGKKYGVCVLPYQMGIYARLFSKEQMLDELSEGDRDPMAFSMEMEALFYGQSESAYFNFDLINGARKIEVPIYPSSAYRIASSFKKKIKKQPKHEGEIRALCIDVAVVGGTQNDASAFYLMQLIPDKRGYLRKFVYGETRVGMNTVEQSMLIRRLYTDLECDYIVLDRANAGVAIYTNLTYPMYDKERGVEYESWTSMNEKEMQDLCSFENAKPVIYTISATPISNDAMARSVKDMLMQTPPRITFLGGREEKQQFMESYPEIATLQSEEQAAFLLPFEETDCLVNEMVQLERRMENQNGRDLIKLVALGKKRKDRYTAIGYGNEFANYLERQNLLNSQDTELADYFAKVNSAFGKFKYNW